MLKTFQAGKFCKNISSDRAKGLYSLVILGFGSALMFRYGHPYYAAMLIIFYFFLFISKLRIFTLVAACVVLAIFLNKPAVNTWSKIYTFNTRIYPQLPYRLSVLFEPNSGQEVLPADVIAMRKLIQAHRITSYRLANKYANDKTLYQRSVEFLWPAKIANNSPYFFYPSEEQNQYSACQKIDQFEGVALGYCN